MSGNFTDNDDEDELDILASTLPALTQPEFVTTRAIPVNQVQIFQPNVSQESRKSARLKEVAPVFHMIQQTSRKRGNTAAVPDVVNKRLRMEDKKANTVTFNEKRSQKDFHRNQWLLRHREFFEPLLPPSHNFDHLRDEKRTNATYVPPHELSQPKLIDTTHGLKMKDYQILGLSFLAYMYENGMNCILGDEMGLGKTLQTLSLFAYIAERNTGPVDPHLIVCPLSVMSAWESEAARWLPSMRVVRFHGAANERVRLRNTLREGNFDIVVTTYEAYVIEDSWFKSRRWTYCVLDEGHRIKNCESIVSQKLQGLNPLYRLILTGTPIQNDLTELWGLLHYLYPNIFTLKTGKLFQNSFNLSEGQYSIPFVNAARNLLSKIMIRRTKANVSIDVPPREEQTVFIPLTEMQRFWTYRLITRLDSVSVKEIFDAEMKLDDASEAAKAGRQEVMEMLESTTKNTSKEGKQWTKLMNLLMQLRRICDHPYLLPNVEPDPYFIGEHLVASSSKLITIDKILAEILPKKEKVLIFSQWTGMLDVLEDMMHLRSIKYARLDGSTTRPRRALDIKLFQHEKSDLQVYLIATKAGGLGINLTKASTVIMADSDWNPQNDIQAIARAHRIGQTKTVKVYRLICGGSVEDQMLDRLRRKLFLSVKMMGSDNPGSTSESSEPGMNSSVLIDILRKGSSALVGSGNDMDLGQFIQAPIHEILSMSRARGDARDAKMQQSLQNPKSGELEASEEQQHLVHDAEEEERRLLSGVAHVRCRMFEGRTLPRTSYSSNQDISKEWNQAQKRARTQNGKTVEIDGMTFVVDPTPNQAIPVNKPAAENGKRHKKEPIGSEDHCNVCEDGGELYLCAHCPRVFHAECRGIERAHAQKKFVVCHQHACCECSRSTQDAGGMLFRCRTCPQAYCEDCLPEPFDPIGETLPELLLLNYGATQSAYYISCSACNAFAQENPRWKASWEEHCAAAEEKLRKLEAAVDKNI